MEAGGPGAPTPPAVEHVEEEPKQEEECATVLHLPTVEPSVWDSLTEHSKQKAATWNFVHRAVSFR